MSTQAWWADIEVYLHPTRREVSFFSVQFGTGQPCVALRGDKYHPKAHVWLSWPARHEFAFGELSIGWEPLMRREQLTEVEWLDLNRLTAETYLFTVSKALGLGSSSASRLGTPADCTHGTDPKPREIP